MRRILAIIGVVFLVGLYITTFIVSIVSTRDTMTWLYTSVAATVLVSVVLYAINMYAKNLDEKKAEEAERALKFKMAMEEMVRNRKKAEEEKNNKNDKEVKSKDLLTIEEETKLRTLKSLVEAGSLSEDKACEAAGLSLEEFKEKTSLL